LPTARMTAFARRWQTVEINTELLDIGADPWPSESLELCGCYDCAWGQFVDDVPPIPPITLFDAYKAKRNL
jgi:hypothetical protein